MYIHVYTCIYKTMECWSKTGSRYQKPKGFARKTEPKGPKPWSVGPKQGLGVKNTCETQEKLSQCCKMLVFNMHLEKIQFHPGIQGIPGIWSTDCCSVPPQHAPGARMT